MRTIRLHCVDEHISVIHIHTLPCVVLLVYIIFCLFADKSCNCVVFTNSSVFIIFAFLFAMSLSSDRRTSTILRRRNHLSILQTDSSFNAPA